MNFGLANRFALLFALLVVTATATVGFLVYQGSRNALIEASTDRLADTAHIIKTQLDAQINEVRTDVRFLGRTPQVEGIVRLQRARRQGFQVDPQTAMTDLDWRNQLADVFTSFLEDHPEYRAIHLVEVNQTVRLAARAEQQDSLAVWVPRRTLGTLPADSFFDEVADIPLDTVFFSKITLRAAEGNRKASPELRAVWPLADRNGWRYGALVLDVDLRDVFSSLDALLPPLKSLYLANRDGRLLVRPASEGETVIEETPTLSLETLFPEVVPLIQNELNSLRIEEANPGGEARVSAYFQQLPLDGVNPENTLFLGVTSPHSEMLGRVEAVRVQSMFTTLLFSLSGILIALFLSRVLSRPLRRITQAMSQFGKRSQAEPLPVHRSDEIGVLARTYEEMARQIEDQVVKLEDRERRQRTILETSAEGIIVTDDKGLIETFNPAAERILGYEAPAVLGTTVHTLLTPTPFDTPEKGKANGKLSGKNGDATGLHGAGIEVPLSATWSSFELGGARKYTVLFQDITERKAAEAYREQLMEELRQERERLQQLSESLEERVKERTADLARTNKTLEQRNRELQDFAYVASHDLQEPLRKIQAFSSLLETEYSGALGEEARFYVERMENAASRMSRLITDLLDFSRVTTKANPFTEVDLNLIVQEVLSDLEVQLNEVGGQVRMDTLPSVEVDPTQMRQLLQNLVSNGLKFHRSDVAPLIEIRGRIESDHGIPNVEGDVLCLEVEDNGIGFEEKYAERIFAPFQRLHGRGEYTGTGMGLAICRRIVERHHGEIRVQSTPGEGTVFTICLPVEQQGVEAEESFEV